MDIHETGAPQRKKTPEKPHIAGALDTEILRYIADQMSRLAESIDGLRNEVREMRDEHEQIKQDNHLIKAAFPDLDFDAHHDFHKASTETKQKWDKRMDQVFMKLIEWGSVAATGWIGVSLWNAFLAGPK